MRVRNFHLRTVDSALDIVGAMGHTSPADVTADQIMKRISVNRTATLAELYPTPDEGSFLTGSASEPWQSIWKRGGVQLIKAMSVESVKDSKTSQPAFNKTAEKVALPEKPDAQKAVDALMAARVVNLESSGMLPVSSPLPAGTEIFVSDIDLKYEQITLSNPTETTRDISGYTLSDSEGKSKFKFPNGTSIKGNGVLHIYCTAKPQKGAPPPKTPFIYWLNKTGKKPIIANLS